MPPRVTLSGAAVDAAGVGVAAPGQARRGRRRLPPPARRARPAAAAAPRAWAAGVLGIHNGHFTCSLKIVFLMIALK